MQSVGTREGSEEYSPHTGVGVAAPTHEILCAPDARPLLPRMPPSSDGPISDLNSPIPPRTNPVGPPDSVPIALGTELPSSRIVYVKPSLGLTFILLGAKSVRSPNAVSIAGLYAGAERKWFPSRRTPYSIWNASDLCHQSPTERNPFHVAADSVGIFRILVNPVGALVSTS